jgi:hypothetical protein
VSGLTDDDLACLERQGRAVVRVAGVPLLRAAEQEGVNPGGQPAVGDEQPVAVGEAVAVHGHQGTVLSLFSIDHDGPEAMTRRQQTKHARGE